MCPTSRSLKSFDMKMAPVLLYRGEIWGLKQISCIENIQNYAGQTFLNIAMRACNAVVSGDLAAFPVSVFTSKRCIKYWLRILQLPGTLH